VGGGGGGFSVLIWSKLSPSPRTTKPFYIFRDLMMVFCCSTWPR
jgi:hypothetical protein